MPREEAAGRCIGLRVSGDGYLPTQQESGTFATVGWQYERPQLIEMVLPQSQAETSERGHAARSAATMRLSTVQIPSRPRRHSLLWRLQRCQERPANWCAALAAWG